MFNTEKISLLIGQNKIPDDTIIAIIDELCVADSEFKVISVLEACLTRRDEINNSDAINKLINEL